LGETGSRTLGTVWGGTFHSVANRLLRTYGEAIGLDSDFTVMDQSDAEDLMDASRHDNALGSKEETVPPQTDVSLDLLPLRQQFRSPRPYASCVLSVVHRVGAGTAATFQIVYRSKAGAARARL
jgi:superfamily I DNA/RNA helicase